MKAYYQNSELVKKCSMCKITKPAADFYKEKLNTDGLKNQCKLCILKVKAKKLADKNRRKPSDQHGSNNPNSRLDDLIIYYGRVMSAVDITLPARTVDKKARKLGIRE